MICAPAANTMDYYAERKRNIGTKYFRYQFWPKGYYMRIFKLAG